MNWKKSLISLLMKRGIYIYRKAHTSDFELRNRIQSELIRQSNGILHIGGHLGQEAGFYSKLEKKVLWIEALPEIHRKLETNILAFPDQYSICALLGDKDGLEVEFHIADNDGASSSLYSPEWKLNPPFSVSSVTKLIMNRLDSVLTSEVVKDLEHWVIDVQGAELPVLRGAGDYLQFCNSLVIEAKEESYYQGGTRYSDLLTFLLSKGFIPLWSIEDGVEDNVFFVRIKRDK
jgi:FkbM family methyltransferase